LRRFEGWGTGWITKLKCSLTAKIFLVSCVLLTLVSVLTYGLIARLMPLTYAADREKLLMSQAAQLLDELKDSTLETCGPLLSQFTLLYDAPVSIQDSQGNVAGGMDPAHMMLTEDNGRWETSSDRARENPVLEENGKEEYMVHCIGYDFSFRDSRECYQLLVFVSTHGVNQAVEALGRIWPWLAAGILLMSVLTSLFYARFITRPVVRLSAISQRLSELDFSRRCREKRMDEIGTLARSLDQLADRLSGALEELQDANAALQEEIRREQQREQAQREFFSAASHELKTPITVIKGQLGGMLDRVGVYEDRDKYLARSLTVVSQMEGLVRELLMISRMEKGEASQTPVELTALVRECLEDYGELFWQKGQLAKAELPGEAWTLGETGLLKKALGSLFSNAALYSPEGAKIHFGVRKEEDSLFLTVENEGTQIAPELLPHLFEPFFRGDPSRNSQTGGSGLGLYLVQRIAWRYGGSCQIQNTRRGVCVTLKLPGNISKP
jgi:two-component system sensor histidine kinase VanS